MCDEFSAKDKDGIGKAFVQFREAVAKLGWEPATCEGWRIAVETHPRHMIGEVILLAHFSHEEKEGQKHFCYNVMAEMVLSIDFDFDYGFHVPCLNRSDGLNREIYIEDMASSEDVILYDNGRLAEQFMTSYSAQDRWYIVGFER